MSQERSIEDLVSAVSRFAADREWSRFHDPKNLAMALSSEAGELLAILRWIGNADSDAFSRTPENAERIRNEIADVGILLLLLCERLNVSLSSAIDEKLKLNEAKYPVERSRGRSEPPSD